MLSAKASDQSLLARVLGQSESLTPWGQASHPMTTEPRYIDYPAQHNGALHVLSQHERTTLLIAGRKWRKSSNVLVPSQAHDLCDGIEYIHVAPTYDQVLEVFIELRKSDTENALHFDQSRREITCPYSGGRGVYRSMDRAENVRSKNAAKIYADEIQGITREDYDRVVLPIGLNYDVEEILVGTANGHDWVHEYGQKIAKLPGGRYWRIPTRGYRWDEDGKLIHEPHPLENDRIPFERIVHYADRLSRAALDQEIGAKLVAKVGCVCSEFDREIHAAKKLSYNEKLPLYLSVDPGLNVTAVGFYQVDTSEGDYGEAVVHKIGEATFKNRSTPEKLAILTRFKTINAERPNPDESLAAVDNLPSDWVRRVEFISMDPAANAREEADKERTLAHWAEIFPHSRIEYSYDPTHKSPEWRAGEIKTRLRSATGTVREYVDPCCVDSIESYEQLAYDKKGEIPPHSPYKHHFDERGYFEVNRFCKREVVVGSYRRAI